MTDIRDIQVQFAAKSSANMQTTSSVATGYSYGGWSLTNFTPNRNVRGDDTLATIGKTLATLIQDLIVKGTLTP